MNTALSFLEANRDRLDLDRYGAGRRLSCVAVTPRFRASRHVVFLVLSEGKPDPVLVVKMARLPGTLQDLEREAANLEAARAACGARPESVPQLVACEEYHGHPVLVETALAGRPMEPAVVRRRADACCRLVLDWLGELQGQRDGATGYDAGWFSRPVDRPLHRLSQMFPMTREEAIALDRTWGLAGVLRSPCLPLVFEHGDLGHPNLFLLPGGGVGVIDWEWSEPHGLPAQDLFFFLTYVAFARSGARTPEQYLRAFYGAFFGKAAWSRPYVLAYARRVGLPPAMLIPLFVVCWGRRVANLLGRLAGSGGEVRQIDSATARWLRGNRYYALWRLTLDHLNELQWDGSAPAHLPEADAYSAREGT